MADDAPPGGDESWVVGQSGGQPSGAPTAMHPAPGVQPQQGMGAQQQQQQWQMQQPAGFAQAPPSPGAYNGVMPNGATAYAPQGQPQQGYFDSSPQGLVGYAQSAAPPAAAVQYDDSALYDDDDDDDLFPKKRSGLKGALTATLFIALAVAGLSYAGILEITLNLPKGGVDEDLVNEVAMIAEAPIGEASPEEEQAEVVEEEPTVEAGASAEEIEKDDTPTKGNGGEKSSRKGRTKKAKKAPPPPPPPKKPTATAKAAPPPPPPPPTGKTQSTNSGANAYYEQGKNYIRAKKVTLAVESLRRCISIDPRHAACYRTLGVAYSLIGSQRKAIQAFEVFVKIAPTHPDTPKVKALIADYYKRQGK